MWRVRGELKVIAQSNAAAGRVPFTERFLSKGRECCRHSSRALFFGTLFRMGLYPEKNFRKHKRAATSLNISGPPLVERM